MRKETLEAKTNRVVAEAQLNPVAGPLDTPCWISRRTPAASRPLIKHERTMWQAARAIWVVCVRPIPPDHQIHHRCEVGRCVRLDHLQCLTKHGHTAIHAEEQRQDRCSTHGTPYESRNSKGWGQCAQCRRDAAARWKAKNPDKVKAYRASTAGRESQRRASKKYSQTEEYKARARAKQRARRARIKAEKDEGVT